MNVLSNSIIKTNQYNFGFKKLFKLSKNTTLDSVGDTSSIIKIEKLENHDLILNSERNVITYGTRITQEMHCISFSIGENDIINYNSNIFFKNFMIPLLYSIVLITYYFPRNSLRIMFDKQTALELERDKSIFKNYLSENKDLNGDYVNCHTIHDLPDKNNSEFKGFNKVKIKEIVDFICDNLYKNLDKYVSLYDFILHMISYARVSTIINNNITYNLENLQSLEIFYYDITILHKEVNNIVVHNNSLQISKFLKYISLIQLPYLQDKKYMFTPSVLHIRDCFGSSSSLLEKKLMEQFTYCNGKRYFICYDMDRMFNIDVFSAKKISVDQESIMPIVHWYLIFGDFFTLKHNNEIYIGCDDKETFINYNEHLPSDINKILVKIF